MKLLRLSVAILGLLLLWQVIVIGFQLPPYILPTPLAVLETCYQQAQLLLYQAIPTITETLLGLLLGIAFGAITALAMAYFRPVKFWLLPIVIISQATPTFAIAPLLVIWFGFGMTAKIITTMLMIFFPVASAFFDGLTRTEIGWLNLAKTMNAKKWRVFCFIRIPAALPHLASGVRLATVFAPIGAIIGEWVGSNRGLGFLMLNANAHLQIDLMFAALLAIIIFSLSLYFSVNKLLQHIVWNQQHA